MKLGSIAGISLTGIEIEVRIVSSTTAEEVRACAAVKHIITGLTSQRIVVRAAVEGIVLGSATEQIVARQTVEGVIAIQTENQIGSGGTIQCSIVATRAHDDSNRRRGCVRGAIAHGDGKSCRADG